MPQGKPWEKYGAPPQAHPAQQGPWDKYAAPKVQAQPAAPVIGDPGMLARAGDTITDIGKGVVKGVASTVEGGGKLIRNIPWLGPMLAKGPEVTLPFSTKPSNTAQSIGKGAEQIGEFFTPTGLVSKGVKAVEGVAKAAKLTPLAQKFASLAGRAGLEAGSAGAVTALQTGGDTQAIENAAGFAAAIPAVGAAVKPMADVLKKTASQKLPRRMIEQIIRPPKKQLAFARDPGGEVARMGITANSLEGLETAIKGAKEKTGKFIDSMLQSPSAMKKRVDVVPAINGPIDEAIQQAKTTTGNTAVVSRLESMREALLSKRFNVTNPKAIRLSPLDARKLKTEIGETIRWSEDPIEGTAQQVVQKIYRNLNDAIDKEVDGVKLFNRKYSNLLAAEKSTADRIDAVARTNTSILGLGLSDLGTSVAIGALQAMNSGDMTSGGLLALGTGAALRTMKSPAASTRLAAQFAKLSPDERTIIASQVVPLLRNLALRENATSEVE